MLRIRHHVTLVSSCGLATRRSSELNASINSGASKARLRRPTLIWASTPASTSRSIPWLVAWNDRPINSAAVDTVNTGAAGSAPMSRRTAESRRVVPTRSRQDDCNSRTCSSNWLAYSTARLHAEAKKAIQRLIPAVRCCGVGRADVAGRSQTIDIVQRPARQYKGDRR